jgi:hypothetical protein
MTTKELQHGGERLCKCCGAPKPLTEFRVVGPPGCRRRLSTRKGCQKRLGLGTACHSPQL